MGRFATLLYFANLLHASIYHIDYTADDHTYTEGNMYDSDHGPFGVSGDSTIKADLDVKSEWIGVEEKESPRLVLVFYHHDGVTTHNDMGGEAERYICQEHESETNFADNMLQFGMSSTKRISFQTEANKVIHIPVSKAHYTVQERGLQFLRVTVCPRSNLAQVTVNGTLAYRNPYGYLAGELYPLLPFEAVVRNHATGHLFYEA